MSYYSPQNSKILGGLLLQTDAASIHTGAYEVASVMKTLYGNLVTSQTSILYIKRQM